MASDWISKTQRNKIYERDSFVCCYCGKQCKRYAGTMESDTATLDHVVSQKELAGAATDDTHFIALRRDPRNIVVTCNSCNSSKQHTPLYVWCAQTGKDYTAIIAEIARRTA